MNKLSFYLILLSVGMLSFGCQDNASSSTASAGTTSPSKVGVATTVKGEIVGSEGLTVYFDRMIVNGRSAILDKAEVDNTGRFTFSFAEPLDPGHYTLTIGRQSVDLFLDGDEKTVALSGNLAELKQFKYNITGAPSSDSYKQTMLSLLNKEFELADVINFIDTAANAFLVADITMKAIPIRGDLLDPHKKAVERIEAVAPEDDVTKYYKATVEQIDRKYQQELAQQKVRVGEVAPDIQLASPDGKTYSLSDLKGQVVLLDFWASWCGPCRRANPMVVKAYDKFKDKGFTVFSVSLDGPRRMAGLEPAQLAEAQERSKQKWIAAIEKDQLSWPYHVSDLRYWQAAPAKEYGVTSIPRTFLVDRSGKIAAVKVDPRSVDFEQKIEALL